MVTETPDMRALLSLLHKDLDADAGTHVELRAFGARTRTAFADTSREGWLDEVAAFAAQNFDLDVYFGVSGRDGKGGKAENLTDLRALFVDVDFKTTPVPEASLRIALLDALGAPPSVIVHSGGGLHLYWLLLQPLDLRTEPARTRAKNLLRYLCAACAGDLVSAEPVRILRLPGTNNRKPEYGAPRPVEVIGGIVPQGDDPRAAVAGMCYDLETLVGVLRDAERVLREEGKWQGDPAAKESGVGPLPDVLPPGRQNRTLFEKGCALRRQGWTERSIADSLWGLVASGQVQNDETKAAWARKDVDALAKRCAKYEPNKERPTKTLLMTKAVDIMPRAVRWLWDGRVPLGAVSLIAGREGGGKSSVAYETLANITRGELPGEHKGTPRNVAVVATEDSWEHVIVPRLKAARGDLARVFRIEVTIQDLGTLELSLPEDVPALTERVREYEFAAILLDPVISRLGRKLDTHKDGEVRQALEPVARLADQTGCAVLGIIHVNKTDTTDPLTAIMGSRAFAAVARGVLFVAQDRETRLLAFVKNNYGPLAKSRTFTIEPHTLEEKDPEDGRAISTSRVSWGDETDRTARDVLEDQAAKRKVTTKDKAEDWLRERLADGKPAPFAYIKKEAEAEGIPERTLRRAAASIGVLVAASGFPKTTTWALPGEGGPDVPF
jgi:hypothetical protein